MRMFADGLYITHMHRWKLYAKEMLCACTVMLELTDLVQLFGDTNNRSMDNLHSSKASKASKAATVTM